MPGIGPDAAEAVLVHYPTPKSLWLAYRQCIQAALAAGADAVAAAQGMLSGSRAGARIVGPAKSKSVYDNLFANGWNLAD